jgi:hypothetical protein
MIVLRAEHQANGDLKIILDEGSRQELAALNHRDPDRFGCDCTMYEVFEHLLANSEFDWAQPEDIGALTDAPMLGTFGEAIAVPLDSENYCGRIAGQWPDADGVLRKWCEPVLQVHGFMDYQLRSPQEDLLSDGFCVFQGESRSAW